MTKQTSVSHDSACHASGDEATAFRDYAAMRDALNATERAIFFSLCGWNEWYSPVGASLGNSWRIGFESVLSVSAQPQCTMLIVVLSTDRMTTIGAE